MFRAPHHVLALAAGTAALVAGAVTPPAVAATAPVQHVNAAHHANGFVRSGPAVRPNTDGLGRSGMRAQAVAPPAEMSLQKWAVAVGDQGQVGSCVTWAIGYAMLGWYQTWFGHGTTFAPMYLYSQDHGADDSGSSSEDAYAILAKQGIAPQGAYSHSDTDWKDAPSTTDRAAAAPYTTTTPHYLFNLFGGDRAGTAGRQAIETAVAAEHPVAIAFPTFKAFDDLTAKHDVLHAEAVAHQADEGGHEVLVVGYDAAGVRIQNSWGTGWGDHGFATLDWAFVERYVDEASWIEGFTGDAPPTAPAQSDRFSTGWYASDGTATVHASWSGTGVYDDSGRHPVTGWTAMLTGSDGSTRTGTVSDSDFGGQSVDIDAPATGVTYTLSVAATDAVGTGTPQTFSFTPSGDTDWISSPERSAPDLPTPAMPMAAPLPATKPASPTPAFPTLGATSITAHWSAPQFTGHRSIAGYRVVVTAGSGTHRSYRRAFTLGSRARSLALEFAKGGGHRVPGGRGWYRIEVVTRNSAGLQSAAIGTVTRITWASWGWSSASSQQESSPHA